MDIWMDEARELPVRRFEFDARSHSDERSGQRSMVQCQRPSPLVWSRCWLCAGETVVVGGKAGWGRGLV